MPLTVRNFKLTSPSQEPQALKEKRMGTTVTPQIYPFVKLRQKLLSLSVTLSLCRDQQPSLTDIPITWLTAENWVANWKVYASVGSTTVPAKLNTIYWSIGWQGGGTEAPIIRVRSPNHSSPWHTNTWKIGLLFIEHLLEHLQYKNEVGIRRGIYFLENVSSSWITVCTSHPYLF